MLGCQLGLLLNLEQQHYGDECYCADRDIDPETPTPRELVGEDATQRRPCDCGNSIGAASHSPDESLALLNSGKKLTTYVKSGRLSRGTLWVNRRAVQVRTPTSG